MTVHRAALVLTLLGHAARASAQEVPVTILPLSGGGYSLLSSQIYFGQYVMHQTDYGIIWLDTLALTAGQIGVMGRCVPSFAAPPPPITNLFPVGDCNGIGPLVAHAGVVTVLGSGGQCSVQTFGCGGQRTNNTQCLNFAISTWQYLGPCFTDGGVGPAPVDTGQMTDLLGRTWAIRSADGGYTPHDYVWFVTGHLDAGSPVADAGVDAGVSQVDGGTSDDAGDLGDAGDERDAGGSSVSDAGADQNTTDDPTRGGCGCGASGGEVGLAAMLLCWRRRSRCAGMRSQPGLVSLLLILVGVGAPALAQVRPITRLVIDPDAGAFATFQSHNQKVLQNQYGVFISYVYHDDPSDLKDGWRLVRLVDTDAGQQQTVLYDLHSGTRPPPIDTDSAGNVYLAYSDLEEPTALDAYLVKFAPPNFTPSAPVVIPAGASLKTALVVDEPRGELYFMATPGSDIHGLCTLDYVYDAGTPAAYGSMHLWRFSTAANSAGVLLDERELISPGAVAWPHYPTLVLDSNGDLYAAWTTSRRGECHAHYWSIQLMRSPDGAETWQTLKGTLLSIPVVGDPGGPTDMVTRPDELAPQYSSWLSSLLVKEGSLHVFYHTYLATAAPYTYYREHYLRYATSSGEPIIDVYPRWGGETLSLADFAGFCASAPDAPLYCTSRSTDNRLATIVSDDNGASWHDWAATDPAPFNDAGPTRAAAPFDYYAIGGTQRITSDGYVIGTYTDWVHSNALVFFKVKVDLTTPRPDGGIDAGSDGGPDAGIGQDDRADGSTPADGGLPSSAPTSCGCSFGGETSVVAVVGVVLFSLLRRRAAG